MWAFLFAIYHAADGLAIAGAASPVCCQGYWKKTSRAKRQSQSAPIECQYQAMQSTMIWRFSTLRNADRPTMAAMSATMPAVRWAAWAYVMM